MPKAAVNPVLDALRADFESKRSEALKINADPNASEVQLKRAGELADDLPALQARIEKMTDIQVKLDDASDWMSEPVQTVPFSGAADGRKYVDVQGETKDGRRVRYDHVSSPEEKKMMSGGFKSLGHFAWCLYKTGRGGQGGEPSAHKALAEWDGMQRKMVAWETERKSPSGMFEMSDPDGGLLVPPMYSNVIYERMMEQNQILSRLNPLQATSNQIKLRALKEDSRVDGSRGGGILGYWEGEADQYTKSKTQFRPVELNLHKLTVLTYVTEELMMDSNITIDSFIGNLAAKEINFKINDAVINGSGSGMPMGVLKSGSLITSSAVSGQGAGTFVYANVLALYNRVVAGKRGSLIWLYNQDVEPQLFGLYQPTGTAAGVLIFIPNQAGDGFNLMGRPALAMEQCQTAGTAGDVIAFATDGYVCAVKGGLQSFMSMHLRFDYDEFAFKWRFRFDGQTWDDKVLTPFKGSNTYSCVSVLSSTRT